MNEEDPPIYCANCGCEMRLAKTVLRVMAWLCDNEKCSLQIPVSVPPTQEELEDNIRRGTVLKSRERRAKDKQP